MKRWAGAMLLGLGLVFAGPVRVSAEPTYQEVKAAYRSSDILVFDRSRRLLDRVRIDFQGRRGDWIALKDISVALQRAVILSEDKRFYEHAGVDWQAMAAAAWGNLVQGHRRGALTPRMQLPCLLHDKYIRGPCGRSVVQKTG